MLNDIAVHTVVPTLHSHAIFLLLLVVIWEVEVVDSAVAGGLVPDGEAGEVGLADEEAGEGEEAGADRYDATLKSCKNNQ